jgi:predicted NAD-dependent protein-ADP-ribosyltransferase YbiA (DUF1768 family)
VFLSHHLLLPPMGGPCVLLSADGKSTSAGPACTDNFQLRPFFYAGHTFHSAEQAFQALKFPPSSPHFTAILQRAPLPGESGSAHGHACWALGQAGPMRPDWDCIKLQVMLEANRARFLQHADLREELLATGSATVQGQPSTSWQHRGLQQGWQKWNGIIMMRLREELKAQADRVPGLLEGLLAQFQSYDPAMAGAVVEGVAAAGAGRE